MSSNLSAVIVAAGASRRMGFDKVFAPLLGRPLITHSLAAFQECEDVDSVVLVGAAERVAELRELTGEFSKVAAVVPGGRERVESMLAGVAALAPFRPSFVSVHDGARPLVTPQIISATYEAARETGAATAAEPETDTLHRVNGERLTIETVSRKNLWRMQTPQTFERSVLEALIEHARGAGETTTDEISLLIRGGGRARVVDNPDWNFKVTYQRDLGLAEMILRER